MTQVAEIENKEIRSKILDFESALSQVEGAVFGDAFPLKHTFPPGIYAREITIPPNTLLTGKIHRHKHLNFLLKGEVEVFTEFGGSEKLIAPCSIVSEAGTKRVLHTKTECVWTTIHHNPDNLTDIAKLEEKIIAKSYDEYEQFRNKLEYKSVFKKMFSFIKNNLKLN